MPDIIGFAHEAAVRVEVSGGKGSSLARSAQALPVPPGVIIVADAYRTFIRPIEGRVRSILETHGDPGAASERIQRLVRQSPIDSAWLVEIEEAISMHGIEGGVAVRSSGTMEDMPGAAFAGQHDTFLGLRDAGDIMEAVRGCYASLWNEHAMRYRDQMQLSHLQASMAVVVQQMVEVGSEEAAGVAFSIDPVRGDLGSVLINAAFGLGETVVGGEAEVDEYRVSREESDLHDVRVAHKPQALVPDDIAGTRVIQLPTAQCDAPALGAARRAEVARLAVRAEEHFGFPQDIEWAMSNGELYLLQSRPVTRVAPRWTRDESAERFPTPLTPLTWDLVEAGFHASLDHSFGLMGLPSFGDKWFAMRDSYIYGNQTAVELYSGRFPFHLFQDTDSILQALPEIARRYAWVQDLPVQWERDLDAYLIGIGRLSYEPLEGKDCAELWAHVLEINALGAAYFLPNIAISLTQRTLYAALQRILNMVMPTEAAQEMFDSLLAQTDTKTGQVNAELWQLSRQLLRADGLVEWLDEQPTAEGRTGDLRKRFPSFVAELDAFLARHGHRELDFDAYHPTWVEAPHIVVDQLRLLARSDYEVRASPNQLRASQAEAERALLNRMPTELRFFVQEVIRLARVYTALDDLEHYQTTRLTLPLRRGLRALGDALVQVGALPASDDVYFLHVDDLDAAIRDASPQAFAELRSRAQEGRAGYTAATRVNPSWVYGKDDAPDPNDADLRGTAGSPGRVEAEVFVVNGPEDFSRFPPGAILVARTTNPAWTALFYQSAGVITESGGALSHGAVTARELGLPAVMSVRDATRRLENGQRVRVDGTNGAVTLIEA